MGSIYGTLCSIGRRVRPQMYSQFSLQYILRSALGRLEDVKSATSNARIIKRRAGSEERLQLPGCHAGAAQAHSTGTGEGGRRSREGEAGHVGRRVVSAGNMAACEKAVAEAEEKPEPATFRELGVTEVLCEACEQLGWKEPTKIQKEALPVGLEGRDIIGLAETGSGKTGAFAIPILQALLENPQRLFALVLTPTRELAFQISEQFEALGSSIGVKSAVIVGGIDMMSQSLALAKKPHIVIATPGRLIDHLENTKGFNLRAIKYLVMDEADRILNMDFETEVDKILKVIPRDRKTYLFSATMTKKVQKLQRVALKDPVKCAVSTKYQTVEKLQQYYVFIPSKFKDCYLVYILNELAGNSFIIFCSTCNNTQRTALLLRNLGFTAIPLHGQMNQHKRLGALNKFKAKNRSILLATDVASRGLDIPHVDVVINFDIPTHSKDYIHRVGRTARAGRSGKSVTFVTQYDVELFQRIEHLIGKKLPAFQTEEDEVMVLAERVTEAQRFARMQLRELGDKRKRPHEEVEDDSEQSLGIRNKVSGGRMRRKVR
uniref:Probable ATP-dependent RNA helicase DDX47 n=2 Tax=Callorhinchus milii TaxID=7868 RepID=A0A4W3IG36_CALMI